MRAKVDKCLARHRLEETDQRALSSYSVVELLRTGSRRGFSPVCGADACPTRSSTHAGACPCPFSADTARLDPSDRQRIAGSWQDEGLPSLGYLYAAVAV